APEVAEGLLELTLNVGPGDGHFQVLLARAGVRDLDVQVELLLRGLVFFRGADVRGLILLTGAHRRRSWGASGLPTMAAVSDPTRWCERRQPTRVGKNYGAGDG